jgi:hypothetical protein
LIFRSVYIVTFHGNYLLFLVCWPLWCTRRWAKECKHHHGLLLWLSIAERKKRQRSTFVTVTIWWTTTQCREKKSITHIHKNVCTMLDWINLFPVRHQQSSFLSSLVLVPLLDTRDFFSFFYSLSLYRWYWLTMYVTSFSLSLYYDTLIQDTNVDGYIKH